MERPSQNRPKSDRMSFPWLMEAVHKKTRELLTHTAPEREGKMRCSQVRMLAPQVPKREIAIDPVSHAARWHNDYFPEGENWT